MNSVVYFAPFGDGEMLSRCRVPRSMVRSDTSAARKQPQNTARQEVLNPKLQ